MLEVPTAHRSTGRLAPGYAGGCRSGLAETSVSQLTIPEPARFLEILAETPPVKGLTFWGVGAKRL